MFERFFKKKADNKGTREYWLGAEVLPLLKPGIVVEVTLSKDGNWRHVTSRPDNAIEICQFAPFVINEPEALIELISRNASLAQIPVTKGTYVCGLSVRKEPAK